MRYTVRGKLLESRDRVRASSLTARSGVKGNWLRKTGMSAERLPALEGQE